MNKFMKTNKKIEQAVVSGYQAIENSVVTGYKKIEDKFVDAFRSNGSGDAQSDAEDKTDEGKRGKQT